MNFNIVLHKTKYNPNDKILVDNVLHIYIKEIPKEINWSNEYRDNCNKIIIYQFQETNNELNIYKIYARIIIEKNKMSQFAYLNNENCIIEYVYDNDESIILKNDYNKDGILILSETEFTTLAYDGYGELIFEKCIGIKNDEFKKNKECLELIIDKINMYKECDKAFQVIFNNNEQLNITHFKQVYEQYYFNKILKIRSLLYNIYPNSLFTWN